LDPLVGQGRDGIAGADASLGRLAVDDEPLRLVAARTAHQASLGGDDLIPERNHRLGGVEVADQTRGDCENHVVARQLGPGAGAAAVSASPLIATRDSKLIERRFYGALDRDLELLLRG